MKKLPLVIAMGLLTLSGSALAAEDDARQNRALENLDTDGDGSVSFVEFQERGADSLARIDSDDNGVLTLDEFLNGRPGPRFGNRGERNGDRPEREPSEEQIARMEEMKALMTEQATTAFHEMDANGDDVVSVDEFQEASFLNLDSDNNGLLSAEELRPQRGRPGSGRRGPGGHRGDRAPQA